jgi:hypothetical protein
MQWESQEAGELLEVYFNQPLSRDGARIGAEYLYLGGQQNAVLLHISLGLARDRLVVVAANG